MLGATRPAGAQGAIDRASVADEAGSTAGAGDVSGVVLAEPRADQQPVPTPTPVVLRGQLWPRRPGCGGVNDGALDECTGDFYYVRAGGRDLSAYVGDVELEGVVGQCGQDRYVELTGRIQRIQRCPGALPAQKINLALRAPVVASTEQPGQEARNATDGDPLTYWYTPSQNAWLYIDLGQAATFNESRLLWAAPHAVQYALYAWDEATSPPGWVMIQGKRGGTSDDSLTFARAYSRYVLLHLIASSAGGAGGFALREWQIFGVSSPNLALGTQLSASSNEVDARLAVDGDKRTGWASDAGRDRDYPWLRVHFPARTELAEFRVLWDGNAMAPAYWTGFYDGTAVGLWSERLRSRNPTQRLSWISPIEADAFIIMTDGVAPSGFVKLLEIELYGPGIALRLGVGPLAGPLDARPDGLPLGPAARPWRLLTDRALTSGLEIDVGGAMPPTQAVPETR